MSNYLKNNNKNSFFLKQNSIILLTSMMPSIATIVIFFLSLSLPLCLSASFSVCVCLCPHTEIILQKKWHLYSRKNWVSLFSKKKRKIIATFSNLKICHIKKNKTKCKKKKNLSGHDSEVDKWEVVHRRQKEADQVLAQFHNFLCGAHTGPQWTAIRS